MQIRRSVFLLVAVGILLIALILWRGLKRPVETPPMEAITTNLTLPASRGQNTSAVSNPIHTNAPPLSSVNTANVSQLVKNDAERMKEALSTYNDVPIDFYGKLEDQFGNPVADAEIKGSIRVISGTRQSTDWPTTTSDANGMFEFHGRGQDISMMPSKKGYALASLNGGGNYSLLTSEAERAHPDRSNPVVIKMWKLQGAEPLVGINCQFKFPYTDAPIYFDLIAGKIVPAGGDIKVTVTRSAGIISVQNRVNWNVKIEAVEGGLMDPAGTERITYFAPENGYEPSKTIYSTDRLPEGGFGGFRTSFYVKSRNGQVYSKLGLSFKINLNPDNLIYIRFNGIANTNSSRNWEATAPH